ncbi:hypothetical protein QZH41_015483, partial [Actinostola sp. cb2023]
YLKSKLQAYVSSRLRKVRIIRTAKREGLIRARLIGASTAKGQVITFLDAHCEANVGWLEPLLSQRRLVCERSEVDSLPRPWASCSDVKPLTLSPFSSNQYEGDVKEPVILFLNATPTMAGGLFSIDRKYFFESGSYDEGMDVWGGENLEMSFRIRNPGNRMCVDTMGRSIGGALGYSLCHGMGGNQLFYLKPDGQMQSGDEMNPLCVEALGEEIVMMGCDITSQTLQWEA